jgi:peroxiredoxin Q/BCP
MESGLHFDLVLKNLARYNRCTMSKLSAGLSVPDFSLDSTLGKKISPLDFRGKWTVLYFYPKDDTSGCTKEACGFRDAIAEYRKRGVEIYGVSGDDLPSHEKFVSKYRLPFPLLSDPSHEMLEDFGVWVEKSMYGKSYMGISRTTFVVDPDGRVAKIFEGVDPDGHADEILKYLDTVRSDWSI